MTCDHPSVFFLSRAFDGTVKIYSILTNVVMMMIIMMTVVR